MSGLKRACALGVIVGLALLFSSPNLRAGHKIGNGGGAWVCREPNGTIRWSNLVDLFEATEEFGLTLAQYPGSTKDVLDQVLRRIAEVNPELSTTLDYSLQELYGLEPHPPQVTYTDNIVVTIDDSLYRLRPSSKHCAGGAVTYEQVVNYKEDGLILVAGELYSSLSNNAKAALALHEAIYKLRRDTAGDATSVVTRRMVGLFFSTISANELKKQLESLGELDLASIGMRFVPIPAGTFLMGMSAEEIERTSYKKYWSESAAQHRVILTHPFEMQTTAVTQAQYARIMGVNPSYFQEPKYCPKTYEVRQGIAMCPDHPVEMISYDDAQKFVSKFNSMRHDGYVYRLPTDAEWEYAARAGTTTTYYFGNDLKQISQFAWVAGSQTHEVGKLTPNPFGLYDMLGNVNQWASDWYEDMRANTVTDPKGPLSGQQRVIRGANWLSGVSESFPPSLAMRGREYPEIRRYYQGVRLVRVPRN